MSCIKGIGSDFIDKKKFGKSRKGRMRSLEKETGGQVPGREGHNTRNHGVCTGTVKSSLQLHN